MVEARDRSQVTVLKPASRSGENALSHHHGWCSGVSFTRRPGDTYYRNDP